MQVFSSCFLSFLVRSAQMKSFKLYTTFCMKNQWFFPFFPILFIFPASVWEKLYFSCHFQISAHFFIFQPVLLRFPHFSPPPLPLQRGIPFLRSLCINIPTFALPTCCCFLLRISTDIPSPQSSYPAGISHLLRHPSGHTGFILLPIQHSNRVGQLNLVYPPVCMAEMLYLLKT